MTKWQHDYDFECADCIKKREDEEKRRLAAIQEEEEEQQACGDSA